MKRLKKSKILGIRRAYSIFLLGFLIFLTFQTPLFFKEFTQGFHLARFEVSHRLLGWQERRSIALANDVNSPVDSTVLQILNQPFFYLNRGAQCYAFESKDHQYVLKIFHENREATPFRALKQCFSSKKARPRHVLRDSDLDACLIAYRLAKEETALSYIHLLPTRDLLPRLAVKDPIGRKFYLPLDRYAFVLQKKAAPFRKTLFEASLKKELPVYLTAFFSLIERRVSKGIYNKDFNIAPNFGFLGKVAIELDFGRYAEHPDFLNPSFQKMEKEKFAAELREWILQEMPHELDTFETTLAQFRE